MKRREKVFKLLLRQRPCLLKTAQWPPTSTQVISKEQQFAIHSKVNPFRLKRVTYDNLPGLEVFSFFFLFLADTVSPPNGRQSSTV